MMLMLMLMVVMMLMLMLMMLILTMTKIITLPGMDSGGRKRESQATMTKSPEGR